MKILFEEGNKKLTVKECDFDAVEIYKDGEKIFDIPLTNGEGFVTNQEEIFLEDSITVYPYNVVEIEQLQTEQEVEL